MSNLEKYKRAFIESLEVTEDVLDNLSYQDIPSWDSVGHMTLVAALEEVFDIMFSTEDIIDLNSYKKGMEILSASYSVKF